METQNDATHDVVGHRGFTLERRGCVQGISKSTWKRLFSFSHSDGNVFFAELVNCKSPSNFSVFFADDDNHIFRHVFLHPCVLPLPPLRNDTNEQPTWHNGRSSLSQKVQQMQSASLARSQMGTGLTA
jgi:hypothetical protein